MNKFLLKHSFFIFCIVAFEVSFFAGLYFVFIDNLSFAYIDASTRINIARRIFDSLTPGLGQIGGVWPPFPQIIMTPFVSIDFLWRTGIAGWVVSGSSFVISTIYIFKIVKKLTSNSPLSYLFAAIFMLNINLLYLQSTAMSEVFFIMCLVLIFYCILSYIQTSEKFYLVNCSIFTLVSTLTRFESYAIFAASILIILFYSLLKKYPIHKTEGTMLLYLTPAALGIFLWTMYLWTIFGDPLFWLHYYASISFSADTQEVVQKIRPSLWHSTISYLSAIVNMNGIVTAVMGFLGFLFVLVNWKIEFKYKLLLIYPCMLFLFYVFSLSRNTVIVQPEITLYNLLHKPEEVVGEFNLRYGLLMLPYLIIFSALLVNKIKLLFIPVALLFLFQVFTYFYTPLNFTYQLRSNLGYGIPPYVSEFKKVYHGGLILISAALHDSEMNQLGVPYKSFIYEGTQHYWKDSLKKPGKYASWIIFRRNNPSDAVAVNFNKVNLEKAGFLLEFKDGDLEVYKKAK